MSKKIKKVKNLSVNEILLSLRKPLPPVNQTFRDRKSEYKRNKKVDPEEEID